MRSFRRLTINEALEVRKFNQGQVKFSKSTLTDPHVVTIINAIAQARKVTPQEVARYIQSEVDKFADMVKVAPVLYHTIKDNLIEGELFKLLQSAPVETKAVRFSTVTFFKLVRSIAADHDEFWPLRSYLDKRRLVNPTYQFVDTPTSDKNGVPTAAATPGGTFIFNVNFMQDLMDYANLKGVRPKGLKYISNGGDIPDEYAYIEFLILHEFMHYSNDDFYYQKMIPGANPMIINWVGDFRSNYLLVKSGYEQLPMGLFNDMVNYDRQKEYIDMYRIVEDEFKKLNQNQQQQLSDKMNEMSDDHEPGQKEGAESDVEGTPSDADKAGKQTEKQIEQGEDKPASERKSKDADQGSSEKNDGEPGTGAGTNTELDYTKVMPTFSWKQIIQRFLKTAKPKHEETYTKPHRRGVTGLEVMRQTGAGAVKPAERISSMGDAKLAFCFDTSGSMSGVITTAFANAANLLKQSAFKNLETVVFKFTSSYSIYRCNFARNIATKVSSVEDKARRWETTTSEVFKVHDIGGTVFSSALAGEIISLTSKKWNVIFFLDSDILYNSNFTNFMSVIKAAPGSVFVVFDSRQTYLEFRQKSGVTTPNISYWQ